MIAIAVDDEILMLGALVAAIQASPDVTEVVKFSGCEEALEFINDDELVEVTPDDIRLRKKLLHELERRRSNKVYE